MDLKLFVHTEDEADISRLVFKYANTAEIFTHHG